MIASIEDVMILTMADFERLPEGFWEVVDGRAILLPGPEFRHQKLTVALALELSSTLKALGTGHVVPTVSVGIPVPPGVRSEIQIRIPDLVVSLHEPDKIFEAGAPPELVIEILSTRRGNVERTQKLDDYSRAGIPEYWIVNPFECAVEVYLLKDGDYELAPMPNPLRSTAIEGLVIDVSNVWRVLD